MYLDPTYILVIIGALLCLAASAYVKSTYSKYSSAMASCGMTGAQVAQKILRDNDITDVSIGHIQGQLTDNYNPSKKTVFLSDSVYDSNSVVALAVAAHECGHVLQHYKGYIPIKIRSLLVPLANIGSKLGLPMVIIGILLGGVVKVSDGAMIQGGNSFGAFLCTVGIWVFALAVAFQIVTLPVEFNASKRAMRILENANILRGNEISYASKVLTAAALTYVAAAASSILQLLRLVILAGGRGRGRRD